MRLGYFAMPSHPASRCVTDTLNEDRQAIILADKLGYYDAFIGEHLTDLVENVTNSMMFLATLIHSTENIKLATGTTNLAHHHPVMVAAHAAMFDHLSRGRFILGVSAGAIPSDYEVLGIDIAQQKHIFAEALDVILSIWKSDPPYNIQNNRFKVSTMKTIDDVSNVGKMYKPYQYPRPEIVGTVVEPHSKGAVAMGEKSIHPLSANFVIDDFLSSHWNSYKFGQHSVGVVADRNDWRIARTIFVNEDDKVAREYGKDSLQSPYRLYYKNLLHKLLKGRKPTFLKNEGDTSPVVFDDVIDKLIICGSVNKVVDDILYLNEKVNGFGELVYAGIDWADPMLSQKSMKLMAEQVMPRVRDALK